MKTKRTIYFLLVVLGALVMSTGDWLIRKEYALSIGIVLLMLGVYKSSLLWSSSREPDDKQEQ